MTDPRTSLPGVPASLVDRVKNLLLTPKTEWPRIDGEPATVSGPFHRLCDDPRRDRAGRDGSSALFLSSRCGVTGDDRLSIVNRSLLVIST